MIPNISTQQSLMPHSHTKLIQINTFAPSKLLIQVYLSRIKRELEMEVIMPLWSFTLRDLKISLLFQELEMSSEFTELLWDFIITTDNSMPIYTSIVHGHYSQQIKKAQLKKQEFKKEANLKMFLINSLENISISIRANQQYYQPSENGQHNTFKTIML